MGVYELLILTPTCSGEEAIPAKKTKTLISGAQISQTHHTEMEQVGHNQPRRGSGKTPCSPAVGRWRLHPQRMETSFHTSTMMKVQVEEAELAHKTPPRVLPKPTSKSPTPMVAKVAAGRQQSPSPVRHVKAPTPTPVR